MVRDQLLREVAGTESVVDRIDAVFLDAAPHCGIVANMVADYDNVDVPGLTKPAVLPLIVGHILRDVLGIGLLLLALLL